MKFSFVPLIVAAAAAASFIAPAHAQIYTFAATLTGAAEVPPVTTTAGGSALATFNTQASTVSIAEWFFGLSAPATAAHIHCCTTTPLTGTAPVVLDFTGFPSATTGTYFNTFTLTSTAYNSLLSGALAGKAYFNIHNSVNPGGEIRGNLQLVSFVPEPETYALMLGGLGLVVAAARRRKQA